MRAVLDTNTIISAVLWGGVPWEAYTAAADRYTLLTSEDLFNELSEVLNRPKFQKTLQAKQQTAASLLVECLEVVEFVLAADIPSNVVRDKKDRIVLACAVGGNVDWIVSGDQDLLVLGQYADIPIVRASRFLEVLPSEPT